MEPAVGKGGEEHWHVPHVGGGCETRAWNSKESSPLLRMRRFTLSDTSVSVTTYSSSNGCGQIASVSGESPEEKQANA